jgi:hypothetical protein
MVYSRDGASWRFDLLKNTSSFDMCRLNLTINLEGIYAGLLGFQKIFATSSFKSGNTTGESVPAP